MFYKQKDQSKVLSKLQELKEVPARDPQAAEKGKARFLAQAKMLNRSAVTYLPVQRHSNWKQSLFQERKMGTLITIIMAIGLVFGGSTATVFASQDSAPNEFLYPVKLISEDVQLGLVQKPQSKVELALGYALERIDEISELREAGLMPPDAVFARLENQINLAIQYALSLQNQDRDMALLRIKDQLQERERLMDQDPEDPTLLRTRTILQQRIHLVESGIANPEGLYNELRSGWENIPNSGESTGTVQNQQQQDGMYITPGGTQNQFGAPTQENTPGPTQGTDTGGNSAPENTPGPTQGPNPGGNPGQQNTPQSTQGIGTGRGGN